LDPLSYKISSFPQTLTNECILETEISAILISVSMDQPIRNSLFELKLKSNGESDVETFAKLKTWITFAGADFMDSKIM